MCFGGAVVKSRGRDTTYSCTAIYSNKLGKQNPQLLGLELELEEEASQKQNQKNNRHKYTIDEYSSVLKKMGMLLPDETYEERGSLASSLGSSGSTRTSSASPSSSSYSRCKQSSNLLLGQLDLDQVEAKKALAVLQKCDEFLQRYNIRPEFFCRHRERLALQAWLRQRSKISFGESFYLFI